MEETNICMPLALHAMLTQRVYKNLNQLIRMGTYLSK